jgi:hypothetical protein
MNGSVMRMEEGNSITADGLISFLLKNQVISGLGEPVTLHSICTLSPSVAF